MSEEVKYKTIQFPILQPSPSEGYFDRDCPHARPDEMSDGLRKVIRIKRVPLPENRVNGGKTIQTGYCIHAINKAGSVSEGYKKYCPKSNRRLRCYFSKGEMKEVQIRGSSLTWRGKRKS
tara:strand:+ start:31 stop:390 length:360 start_codon:yes stop_codon:yes gene_type:complete